MLLIRLAAGAIHPRVKMVINIANVASQKGSTIHPPSTGQLHPNGTELNALRRLHCIDENEIMQLFPGREGGLN